MGRHYKSSDSRYYYDWLERAAEDLLSAKLLVQNENCYQSAAFHCQQTAEKSLKAYLLLKTGQLKDGHNLPWLCKQAIRQDEDFHQWLDECVSLNRCYIETRYPADIPLELDYKKVYDYYKMAQSMFLFISNEVDVALETGSSHPTQSSKE